MKNKQNEVAIFNEKQRLALFNIVKQLKIQSPIYFVGSWYEGEFTVQNYNEEYIMSSEDNFLNYYWCEYKAENNDYKISMFYKDFDNGSGNLHILPGAVQVWRKTECNYTKQGFCTYEIEKCKRNNKGEIEYKMLGGRKYCEYGWKPLFDKPIFWTQKNFDEILNAIKLQNTCCIKNVCYSNIFYESVKDYSNGGRSGHYMKYALLKFDFSEESVYYKTIFVPQYGFFTKYDGIKVDYEPGKKVNKCGPNFYCENLKRWIFVDNQYLKGDQTNGTTR